MAPIFLHAIPAVRRLWREARGGVSLIGALSITSLIGMSGLAMEASQGYAQKVANQRVADAAALAAALAYTTSKPDEAGAGPIIHDAALAIAAANGVPDSGVATEGPTQDGPTRKLISVVITTEVPLHLTRMFTRALGYRVSARGVATVADETPSKNGGGGGCIIALSASAASGVTLSGGTEIAANSCVVVANAAITLDGGAHIAANQVIAGGAIATNGGTSITTTPKANDVHPNTPAAASDPLAGDAALTAALDKADNPTAYIPAPVIGDPDTPDDGAQDWTFDWNGQGASVHGFWREGGRYVVPPPPPGESYRVRTMKVGGGVTVVFQPGSRVTISRGFSNGGTLLSVGDGGVWKVNGGFDTGSQGVAMGNSSLAIGQGNVKLTNFSIGDGDLVINATPDFSGSPSIGDGTHAFRGLDVKGTLTIGQGDFISAGKIGVSGGSSLTVKGGDARSIVIGDTGGVSIDVKGGGAISFGPSRAFGATGGISTAGGSSIGFGATANHYVNGTMDLAGAATFGAGAYTIRGDFTNTTGCGNCAMRGTDVSFFLSGRVKLGGGSGLDVRAPETAVGEALPDILFATRANLDTSLTGGTDILLSGVWWTPNAAFNVDGGAKFKAGARCFTIIAATVSLKGGGAISGAGCPTTNGGGKSGPAAVALVR